MEGERSGAWGRGSDTSFISGRESPSRDSTSFPSENSTQEVALWLLGSAVEAANDGFCITRSDAETKSSILHVNPAFTRITGYELLEVLGQSPEFLYGPDTEETLHRQLHPDLNKGESLEGESVAYRKDGSPFQMSWQLMPLPDRHGRISHYLTILKDVTAERQNEKMRSWLEAAVERSDESVIVCDRHLRIRLVNPAFEELTGMETAEAHGLPVWRLPIRPRQRLHWRQLSTALAETDHASLTFEHRTVAIVRLLDLTMTCVRNEQGERLAYVLRCSDVTERHRLESMTEAFNMSKSLGYVFSGIRHELGNPINSIKAALSVLRRGIDRFEPDKVKEYLDNVLLEMVRVEELLRSLRSFNAFEHPKVEPVDVNPFLHRLAQLVDSDLKRQGVHLHVEFSPVDFAVAADPRALLQVMLNLVTNATDAVAGCEEPRLELKVSIGHSQGVFEVLDNGIGFQPEDANRLTQPFYTTKEKGSGLGLSISQKLLSRMNGVLELSGALGTGCRAAVQLNLHETQQGGS